MENDEIEDFKYYIEKICIHTGASFELTQRINDLLVEKSESHRSQMGRLVGSLENVSQQLNEIQSTNNLLKKIASFDMRLLQHELIVANKYLKDIATHNILLIIQLLVLIYIAWQVT